MERDIYSKRVFVARQENMQGVKKLLQIGDKGVLKKIENAAHRYQLSQEYLKGLILKGEPIALAMFAKDPSKQKIHEKIAAEYIQKITGVHNFKDLKHTELYISRGQIITKKQAKLAVAKTIDFYFEYDAYKIYASHKHTTESGGAQDNQYKDLQEFIKECGGNNDPSIVFIAMADGDYYKGNNGRAGVSRIENLRSKCTQSVKVCEIYDLEKLLLGLTSI